MHSVPQKSTARACGKFLCDFLRNAVVFQSCLVLPLPSVISCDLGWGLLGGQEVLLRTEVCISLIVCSFPSLVTICVSSGSRQISNLRLLFYKEGYHLLDELEHAFIDLDTNPLIDIGSAYISSVCGFLINFLNYVI